MLHPVSLVLEVVGEAVDLLFGWSCSSIAATYPPVPNSGMRFGFGAETSEPNFLWWTGFLMGLGLVASIPMIGGIAFMGFCGLVTIMPRPPHRWMNCQDAFRQAIGESWSWRPCCLPPFVEFVASRRVCNGRWYSHYKFRWVCGRDEVVGWVSVVFFVLFVELGVLWSCVLPIFTSGNTHIEIFCFRPPIQCIGIFLQRGSAASTPCFNATTWDHFDFWEEGTEWWWWNQIP